MALSLDTGRLVEPVAADAPCGPDLDEIADPDFLNGMARIEGQLPASFFTRDDDGNQQVFDRSTIDFGRESALLLGLLDRTRDLRLLTLLARLAMLDRDLPGFGQVLAGVAALLETRWESVHPRGESEGYELRVAVLQALDDVPTVILPLQHVPLMQSRRHGPVSFRTAMVADGEVPPRNGEAGPDRAALERVLSEADPDATELIRTSLATVADAAARIGAATLAHGGYGSAVSLERLSALVGRMLAFLGAVAAPAGTAGPGGETEASEPVPDLARPSPVGAIASTGQAAAALAAAARYLRTHEPSSPAEVLVRQAQMLVGRSFLDVMRILMPNQAPEATILIGTGRRLRLTFDQLAAVPDDGTARGEDTQSEVGAPGEVECGTAEPTPHAATRAEAVALLREAGAFFRRSEPASPIPLLLDKATSLADQDFLAILKDVLAEEAGG